jgi:hypothetical protein
MVLPRWIRGLAIAVLAELTICGCATSDPGMTADLSAERATVFGRVVVVLMAPSSRIYKPEVRFFEILNRASQERTQVEIGSDDKLFALRLPPGDYELTRVQIHEGPFASMADLNPAFHVEAGSLTYLGTWRLGVDPPRNERMVLVSVVQDEQDQTDAERQMVTQHPGFAGRPVTAVLPEPPSIQTRLYEVMPYPRYPTYFRRHW